MNKTEKVDVFATELSFIKNQEIQNFTQRAIELLPDYFFKIPASTSKKYHPNFASGDGGLVRHTQGAVRIAKELFRIEMFNHVYSEIEQDIIIASLILHDGNKAGDNGIHTVIEHPILMVKFIRNSELSNMLSKDIVDLICDNIGRHMGQWTNNRYGEQILHEPKTRMQKFVHMCDYIVSRKCVEMNLKTPLSS